MQSKREKSEKFYYLLTGGLIVCTMLMMLLLSYWACRYSYYGAVDFRPRGLLIKDNILKQVSLFLLAAFGTVALDLLLQKQSKTMQEKICVGTLIVTCVIAFCLGVFYVVENPYYPVGDQISTTAFSAYCREGDFIMLCPGGYMGMQQHQKGLGFLYEILFAVFGNFNYTPAKILHVVWWILTICAGYGFLKLNTDRAVFRIVYSVAMLGCIPFLLYLPYIYGDVISICFSTVLFWAAASYEHYEQKRYLVLAAVVASIATLARRNTLIILIALAIYSVLLCLKRKKMRYLLTGGAILLSAALSLKAVDVMYEYRSGYPSGIGIPSILYVAMGLQETEGRAGVYNRYHQTVFEENNFQREPAAQQGKEDIKERLTAFSDHPAMAWDFFKNKLEGQWIEPMYAALETTEFFEDGATLPAFLESLYYGKAHVIVWNLTNYYQSILYLSGLMAIVALGITWWKKKEIPTSMWLPWIAIFGGFLFSILWEAKSRYVFPYCVFMILFVPQGLYETGRMILGAGNGKKKEQKRDNHQEEGLRETA